MYRVLNVLVVITLLLVGCASNKEDINKDTDSKEVENSIQDNKDGNSNTDIDEGKDRVDDADNVTDNSDKDKEVDEDITNKYRVDMDKSVEENIELVLDRMTLEEKVGQMFMIDANSLNNKKDFTEITVSAKKLLKQYKLGGIIFFKNNIVTIEQTQKLINDLQESSAVPLFISVDEEGGLVSRIAKNPNMHATVLPNSKVIGETKDPKNAYKIGTILGSEIASLGFNMDFAPVADVNTNKDNPVIGVRAYGSDENLVGEMVYNAVLGIQDQNVSAVIKHFPGHGDTTNDTHTGSVVVNHDLERLRKKEFIPFKRGIEASVDGVMIAHIKVPNVTKENVEASLSKEIITDLLRKELGYDGLVITDALNMGAIAKTYDTKETCTKAILAGVDILLMPIPFEEGYNEVIKRVNTGVITEDRINESVKRILEVKIRRKLFESNLKNPEEILGNKNHKQILESIR